MKYQFTCSKCGTQKEVEMTVAEYEQYTAFCETCGKSMVRVYEMPKVKGSATRSSESTDVSDTPKSGHTCGSSCTNCSSCSCCG